jgi:hypothetical protein
MPSMRCSTLQNALPWKLNKTRDSALKLKAGPLSALQMKKSLDQNSNDHDRFFQLVQVSRPDIVLMTQLLDCGSSFCCLPRLSGVKCGTNCRDSFTIGPLFLLEQPCGWSNSNC